MIEQAREIASPPARLCPSRFFAAARFGSARVPFARLMLALALAAAFGLCGCDNKGPDSGSDSKGPAVERVGIGEPDGSETSAAEPGTPEPAPAAGSTAADGDTAGGPDRGAENTRGDSDTAGPAEGDTGPAEGDTGPAEGDTGAAATWETLNQEAIELYRTGKLDEAESMAERAVKAAEEEFGKDSLEASSALVNLGGIKYALRKFEESEAAYSRAIDIIIEEKGKDSVELAVPVNNLALLCKSTGRFKEAESFYARALMLQKKHLPENHPDIAGTMNNAGELYKAEEKYRKAERMFRGAMETYEAGVGRDSGHYLIALENLAALYMIQGKASADGGDAETALGYFNKTLALYEDFYGKDDKALLWPLGAIADAHNALGDRSAERLARARIESIKELAEKPGE